MNDDDSFVWPDVPRLAFGFGDEYRTNACVGWALGSKDDALHGYVEGYSQAASALLAWVRRDDASPDYAIWPIAFLWRHHIELGLKRIIAVGRQVNGDKWEFPAGHDLEKLWKKALPFIEQTGDDAVVLANVAANIAEMVRLDPTAAGFRYPFEIDQKTASLKGPPEHVNLAQLDEAMRAVSAFLNGVHAVLEAQLEAQSEPY